MGIFTYKQKKFEGDLKLKLCGKRLYHTEIVKYLGVKIDRNLILDSNLSYCPLELSSEL